MRVGLGDFFGGIFGRRGNRAGCDGHKHISGSWHDQRRAQRLPITMPVLVYGRVGEAPFFEPTETINVSARGGLVPISASVARQQELILTNMQTEEDLLCRVVRLIRSERGQMLAGLEFMHAAPSFWRATPSTND
ncbi:MAG: PilZ domain-containing protein [Candidatus Acidiferrales bacterium]